MEWVYVLIVLVPLLVWVLSTIFRGADEAQAPRRPPAADGAPLAVPRRPANDLDRFLQDAQRRREKAARKMAEAAEEAPPLFDLAPAPPPPPPAPPPAPKAPEPRPRVDEPRPRRERPLAERAEARPAPAPRPEPRSAQTAPAQLPPVAAIPSRRPAGPVLARLAGLLRDRGSLAAGLMLREVLDRPLCQRRRR